MPGFDIGARHVGDAAPVYFVADISANHDGSLERARALIHLAAESGADAAKFQNFRAARIVSDRGFAELGAQLSHQARWRKSVVQVYREASLPWEWTETLAAECRAAGVDYLSTPYDLEAVDMLDPWLPAFKIGSGDITWPEMLIKVAQKNKPVFLGAGASTAAEVSRAVDLIESINPRLCVMQCNTNYTGSAENFRHVHLNTLRSFALAFPEALLGLSDHTPGLAAPLGAVALGARAIEKHFTDDPSREGPDHAFSMTPASWREMVDRTRELEAALGSGVKRIEENERETVIVQRRCLRAARDLAAGETLARDAIDVLRPAPPGSISPWDLDEAIGRTVRGEITAGEALRWSMLT